MDQFHTEIQTLRKLDHPNIIRLYDVYITQDKIFIVMELMEGGELFDYVVQKGTLTEEEASRIVRSVTSALVYMHSKNIIHRDLKPENLLLLQQPSKSGSFDVKIIDFGLSKVSQLCFRHVCVLYARSVLSLTTAARQMFAAHGGASRTKFSRNTWLPCTRNVATSGLFSCGGYLGIGCDCFCLALWVSSVR